MFQRFVNNIYCLICAAFFCCWLPAVETVGFVLQEGLAFSLQKGFVFWRARLPRGMAQKFGAQPDAPLFVQEGYCTRQSAGMIGVWLSLPRRTPSRRFVPIPFPLSYSTHSSPSQFRCVPIFIRIRTPTFTAPRPRQHPRPKPHLPHTLADPQLTSLLQPPIHMSLQPVEAFQS